MVAVLHSRSRKEIQAEIKKIEAASQKHLRSVESARQFLIKGGFITKSGKLTKQYCAS